jgi:hypothetical protein
MIQIQSHDEVFRATVHKDLLCVYSPYFTAALKGEFIEAKQDNLILELDYEQTKLFVGWLYSGRLGDDYSSYSPYIYELYVFADKTNNIALRRSIMDFQVGVSQLQCPREADVYSYGVRQVFHQLPESSGLRAFLMKLMLQECWEDLEDDPDLDLTDNEVAYVVDSILDVRGLFPTDVVLELIALFTKSHAQGNAALGPDAYSCEYHEHESEEEWSNSKDHGRT